MIPKEQRFGLRRLAVRIPARYAHNLCSWMPEVPKEQVERWFEKFQQIPKMFTAARYVNRFKIGADPEFCFSSSSRRCDASLLKLNQGPAFGADNNGRLVEVRPHPSRSAIEVCASILTTLRWMAVLTPSTLDYDWLSGAFLYDDGIGGHVHFGRKRPTRKEEVSALDNIEEALLFLGAYPKDQVDRRRLGDARRQVYGKPGDFRLQSHGYEYRTFPSWLDNPALAFLTLTLSKLAVLEPGLFEFGSKNYDLETTRIKNFLAYFKSVDDDARLARVLLDRGLPSHKGGDFKPQWGISPEITSVKKPDVRVIPLTIKADADSVKEIFDHLFEGKPLASRIPAPTWNPLIPPKGYTMCIDRSNTVLQKGLGEAIWDLCSPDTYKIGFRGINAPSKYALYISPALVEKLGANWNSRFKGNAIRWNDMDGYAIGIPSEWRTGGKVRRLRELLCNGTLPIWKVRDCKGDSVMQWSKDRTFSKPKTDRRLIGRVLWESETHKFGPLEKEN